jgi:septum formation protein
MSLFAALASLQARRVVLASSSPRRIEILERAGLSNFLVIPSTFPENLDKKLFASGLEYSLATAKAKADEVGGRPEVVFDVLISADTVICMPDGSIIEKPRGAEDHKRILRSLSGKSHVVATSVVLVVHDNNTEKRVFELVEQTKVHFHELTEKDVEMYVASGEGADKAGGYAIQGLGGLLVKRIEGCPLNVVGLPMGALAKLIAQVLL